MLIVLTIVAIRINSGVGGCVGGILVRYVCFVNLNVACLCQEKRARVCQMWPRTGSDRSRRTSLYVKSCLGRAQPQMARYRASAAVFAGVGMQR